MTPFSKRRGLLRQRKIAYLAAAIFVCSGITASAACPGNTQLELNECAAAEFQQADAQLNAVWPQVKGYMDSIGQGAVLLDAQRKWIPFRDAACTAEIAPYAGGSIQPLIWYSCLTRLTQTRTFDLQELMRR
ncbi:MAG: lysozyme inhibitor LprI family protein [Paracoccaceae bacterium]